MNSKNAYCEAGTSPPAPVTVSVAPESDIMTVADLATLLKCKESSIYNLTRRRGRARYDNPVPVLRLPCGLRFRRSSILAWLASQERAQ
jgi:predicted DNA-binding transcriptional regulator AlpA